MTTLGRHDRAEHMIEIGDYTLIEMDVPEGDPPYQLKKHIYIRHKSGEGMSAREEILAQVIEKVYHESF